MKKFFFVIALLAGFQAFPWGQTGHRVVGLIAEQHLTKKAKQNLNKVLGYQTLAEVSNYMDFIKSDDQFRHMNPWHYCTIPDSLTYEEAGTPEEGDVIVTIERLIAELEQGKFTDGDELFAVKMLVHLIGDIHQPLHVGKGDDKGGNDVKVKYFNRSTNLHSVWDSGIIDDEKYSYTEYTDAINHPTATQVAAWQSASVLDWAYESKDHRTQVYDMPENNNLWYPYVYKNIDLVNLRLLQAGVRLAGVLNKIYG